MKILLIFPELSRSHYDFIGISEDECLELEYISAVMKQQEHDVFILDGQIQKISVAGTLKAYNPDVVYLCGRSRQENFMLEYCQTAKKFNSKITTIIGGIHAQLCFERLYNENVDYIVKTFDPYKIIEILQGNMQTDGICYRNGAKWISNNVQPFDINKLPLPDRSYFAEHPQSYRYLELEHAAWVRTAFSCPYHCEFCHRHELNSGQYSARNISDVVMEIKDIKADNIYICDDDFLVDRKRITEFIRLVKTNDIRKNYICYGRSDFIANNRDLMYELKEIGLYYCLVGLEAINDISLDKYNKNSNSNNNVESIKICNEIGVKLMGLFLADLDFKPRDFTNLYKWIVNHNLKHVAVTIYTPELCTENYERFNDRIISSDPSHWDYLHLVAKPTHMSVKHFYFCYYKLLLKLLIRAKKDGIYDFLDYKKFIFDFIKQMFVKRSNDGE